MINPEYKAHWRPTTDLGHRYNLEAPKELYMPTDKFDALAYVRELAVPAIVAYDGYPELQQEMIEETATEMFAYLFTQEEPQPGAFVAQSEPLPIVEQCRRPNGQIDANKLAKLTTYAVYVDRSGLEPTLTNT